MPRQARVISNTGYYHIIMRGNNKEYIFRNSRDKRYFMEILMNLQEEELIDIAAWCLMDNHVHLTIKADSENITTAMKRLNIKYAMWYHKKYESVGHVFQDRFKSEPIETDEYLMMVIRYIHQNPVKARMVNNLETYKWSSYNNYIKGSENEAMACVLKLFYNDITTFQKFHKKEDNEEYLEIREDQLEIRKEKTQRIINNFCNKYNILDKNEIYKDREIMKELISELSNISGLSLRGIAKLIGVSYSTVQSHIKKKEE